MIDLDFSETGSVEEVLEELYSPVEDGDYLLLIVDAQEKPGKEGKFPGLNVRFSLVEEDKKSVFHYFYLDPSNQISMAYLKQFLRAVYGDAIDGAIQLDPKDLIGRQIYGTLTQVPRNDDPDKMQNKVSVFSPTL